MALVEDPLTVAEHAVDAPVDEEAEFHVLKFAAGLQVFGGGLVVLRGDSRRENCGRGYRDHEDAFCEFGAAGSWHGFVSPRVVYREPFLYGRYAGNFSYNRPGSLFQ